MSSRAGRLKILKNITGAFTLTKIGGAELELGGANTYGDTFVNEGTLILSSGGGLPAGKTVTVAPGAMLQRRFNGPRARVGATVVTADTEVPRTANEDRDRED